MRRKVLAVLFATALSIGSAESSRAGSPGVGESAPVLAPNEWLNFDGTLDWELLKGNVILIEKWATW